MPEPNCGFLFCSGKRSKAKDRSNYRYCDLVHKNETTTCLVIEMPFNPGCLEHQLHPSDDLIELVITELGIRFAEVGPSMDVVDHQLEVVTTDVVIQASCD